MIVSVNSNYSNGFHSFASIYPSYTHAHRCLFYRFLPFWIDYKREYIRLNGSLFFFSRRRHLQIFLCIFSRLFWISSSSRFILVSLLLFFLRRNADAQSKRSSNLRNFFFFLSLSSFPFFSRYFVFSLRLAIASSW